MIPPLIKDVETFATLLFELPSSLKLLRVWDPFIDWNFFFYRPNWPFFSPAQTQHFLSPSAFAVVGVVVLSALNIQHNQTIT